MLHPANHIFQHTPETLQAWCAQHGMPAFKAAQILEWVYAKGVIDPAAMSNLSKLERQTLALEMAFLSGEIVREQAATDGTRKLLVEWSEGTAGEATKATRHQGTQPSKAASQRASEEGNEDGNAGMLSDGMSQAAASTTSAVPASRDQPSGLASRLRVLGEPVLGLVRTPGGDTRRQTECVMIPSLDPSGPRRTACISSQVGCPVGCRFCASGIGGLDGNLSAGRIVEQVWRLDALAKAEARAASPNVAPRDLPRVSNVVFMGMGEPLSNFAAVTHAIRTLAAPWGMGISARKITVSTVGLPKAIERLAEQLELPVTLALSLHAPTDELRRQLIPWAEYTTIADLLAACQKWFDKTGREITLEYTLLHGVNDRPEHAAALARVAKTLRANVNLIRYNEVAGLPFQRPRTEDVREFQRLLVSRGVNTHIRRSRGRDIAAACGQLRHEKTTAGV